MATDSELLEIRPRLRNDAVFLRVETGVYLRHSETACVLKGKLAYQWISILGPRMNGEVSVGELCDGLSDGQRQTVLRLTGALLAQGFVRDVPPAADAGLPEAVLTRFRPQINLIEHFAAGGDSPAVRFGRFRSARALVAGSAPVLTAAVQGLVRNGMAEVDYVTPRDGTDVTGALEDAAEGLPVTLTARAADVPWPDYDVVIFAAEGDGLGELLAVSRRLRDAAGSHARLLPVVVTGERVVLGPLTGTTTGPCWLCAQLRLAANGDAGLAADLWRELALGEAVERSTPATGTVPAMIGNAAALETFRLFSGQFTAADERHVIVQDATTLESVREPLLPHPACPLCRDLALPPAAEPEDATDEETFERVRPLISPRIGVLSAWADEALEQIPLKIGRVRVAGSGEVARGPRTITAYHPETFLQARVAAVRSALAWYAGTFANRSDVVAGTPARLTAEGHRVIPDAGLLTWSGVAPAGDAPRPYVPAVAVATGERVLVPQAAAYPLTSVNRDARFERVAAGSAAGGSRTEVLAAGLADALAYRGLLAAVRGTASAHELPPETVERDEEGRFAQVSLGHLGRRVRVYALPGARPAYAVLAVLEEDPVWAVGAGASPGEALRAALRDVLGQAQTMAAEGVPADLGGTLPADFDPRTALTEGACGDESPDRQEEATPTGPGPMVAALAAHGLDAYLVDTTTADLRAVPAISTGIVLLSMRPDDPG
ncbi:TOMM precursor leader peptide-binding protein [Actinomadura sp. DC4]|uniref:TOMM precursor leader peptide-binding protein n=1 Tax=Actinomadura sp. DC4 TaxID=3055069 RepID=UPI0025B1F8DA|nr:TOMM precursor leader peptide-binding protein [Actinomadura sp. DC4]MDN3352025.1 TOMM precursor leader peptide-binding protein [Actinomadura sp. DC4]